MGDEFINGELFGSLHEAIVLTGQGVTYYNTVRPHLSLGADHQPLNQFFLYLPIGAIYVAAWANFEVDTKNGADQV